MCKCVWEVGEAPDAQAHEKVPGAGDEPGAESGWAKTLSVPYGCPPSGQGVLAQDSAREAHALWLGRGKGSHQREDPSVFSQDFHSLQGKAVLGAQAVPFGCQGGAAQSQPPEPASVSRGVSEKCPLSPRAALGGGMGLAAGGSTIPLWR